MKNKIDFVRVKLVRDRSLTSDMPLDTPEKVVDLLKIELKEWDREVVCIANLDTKLKPVNLNIASVGTINQSFFSIDNIFKTAILSNANNIIMLHNHPSGDIYPSQIDIDITKRVVEAGKILGINVLDHIIVGENLYSMRENNQEIFENKAKAIFSVGEKEAFDASIINDGKCIFNHKEIYDFLKADGEELETHSIIFKSKIIDGEVISVTNNAFYEWQEEHPVEYAELCCENGLSDYIKEVKNWGNGKERLSNILDDWLEKYSKNDYLLNDMNKDDVLKELKDIKNNIDLLYEEEMEW